MIGLGQDIVQKEPRGTTSEVQSLCIYYAYNGVGDVIEIVSILKL